MFSSILCFDYYCKNTISVCISNDNTLYSCGFSISGCHGYECESITHFKEIPNLINIKQISGGYDHIVCLDYHGDIYSFGSNNSGILGIDKNGNILEHTHIPQKLNLPLIKQVSCGTAFTICLSEDNILYSFGDNTHGQLGLNNHQATIVPQEIPNLNNIEYVICGGNHVICKSYDDIYYSWGNNENGQLGLGNAGNIYKIPTQCSNWPSNIMHVQCGEYFSLLLSKEGNVYSFGSNDNGQLGINDKNINSLSLPELIKNLNEIKRIECGFSNVLSIDYDNNLWVFGNNIEGQLGLEDKENRYKPILHPTLSNIIDISSGGVHTFVKTIDNKIYAMGHNNNSQLGIKTSKKSQLTPIQVLEGKEDIWRSTIGKSRAKSARK